MRLPGAQTYLVGGAVRDRRLGLKVRERDFVVVGSSVEQMLALGFTQVGKDFPVFLHPDTKEEYALARTERKSAPGYHGFVVHADPQVTLEEDLARRDLTINALAEDAEGHIVDPFGGLADLDARLLRHVSPAFAEDPVRILRLARFAARFDALGFRVAPETLELMRAMVAAGEVDALVPDRVWQELSRALGEARPSRFFETLRACGALQVLLPELERLWGVPQPAQWHPEIDTGVHVMLVLDQAARLSGEPEVCFAALCHDLGKGNTPMEVLPSHHGHEDRGVELIADLCTRLPVPKRFAELARLVARYHGKVHKVDELRASTILGVFEGADLLRRPQRFEQLLIACEADFRGRQGFAERDYPQRAIWQYLAQACVSVDSGAIARVSNPARIREGVRQARLKAIKQAQRAVLPAGT
ncbi:multifunctional CCA addition/repair protein [Rhabdochromatium marinum]|uniref:multifunctional CCA addition/repair protein n=1 Tax=Rhabdochromatium marinum TaxID=48729 RepID=UPI0019088D76|nr:multifunctional CCA addition/repair protein [Rhabdochromatium marinum]MBK1647072.1 multifunctional CCA tRNA nucleotidyl transferase/2'3'-cyclic phosphodiesterase/2'nucleotidase/phosphatase [Rhabdochromatium marinum]